MSDDRKRLDPSLIRDVLEDQIAHVDEDVDAGRLHPDVLLVWREIERRALQREEREPDGWLLEVRGLYGEEPHDGERWEPSHVSFREMSPRQRASIYREGRVVPLYRASPTPEREHVIPIHGDCGGPLVEVVARYEDGSYLRISPERLGQQPSGEGAQEPEPQPVQRSAEGETDPRSAYMNARTCICGADARDHRCPPDSGGDGFDPDWEAMRERYFDLAPQPGEDTPREAEGLLRAMASGRAHDDREHLCWCPIARDRKASGHTPWCLEARRWLASRTGAVEREVEDE